eukprot:1157683-Pelagomonas_calceolata.AAC.8
MEVTQVCEQEDGYAISMICVLLVLPLVPTSRLGWTLLHNIFSAKTIQGELWAQEASCRTAQKG